MSITAIAMLTDAYRLANVIDGIESPDAEAGTKGLRALNQLMGQWDRDGINLGWQTVDDQDDTLPIDPQDERCVLYNLAVELAGAYGVEPLPRVQQIASETYGALAKAHRKYTEATFPQLPASDAWLYTWDIEQG